MLTLTIIALVAFALVLVVAAFADRRRAREIARDETRLPDDWRAARRQRRHPGQNG
jgi:hypothetical protein